MALTNRKNATPNRFVIVLDELPLLIGAGARTGKSELAALLSVARNDPRYHTRQEK